MRSPFLRGVAIFIVAFVAFAIGFSRVYLNVHFVSDVLGGFFAGIFFATLMIVMHNLWVYVVNRYKKENKLPDIL